MQDQSFSTFDKSIARAESIINQLESAQAISISDYKRLASEATALLNQCKEELVKINS